MAAAEIHVIVEELLMVEIPIDEKRYFVGSLFHRGSQSCITVGSLDPIVLTFYTMKNHDRTEKIVIAFFVTVNNHDH